METTMNQSALDSAKGEIVMYQLDNIVKLDVRLENESVWLNRQQIALLFDRDIKTIGKHINNALREELKNMSTVANFAIVQNEGGRLVNRNIEFYNLDMVLSVGYRVKSDRGIKFRQWAAATGHQQAQCPVPSCQSGTIQQSPRSFPAD